MAEVYKLVEGSERVTVEDLDVFNRIETKMTERGLNESAWDWRDFKDELQEAIVLAEELGGTYTVNAPTGVRYFVEGEIDVQD